MNVKSSESDVVYVEQLKKDNIEAFEGLFRIYGKRLYHFALGYLKSESEAEELVQEVFTRVWEKRAGLKSELSFKSYIFTIAFNIIRKSFIKKERFKTYLESSYVKADFDIDTTNQVDYHSLLDYLKQLVDKLPARRKEVFMKSRLDGLTVKEIAADMGISPKTVENQLTEAIKFIRLNWRTENLSTILFFILFIG
ncbi:RNA polymerase sigma-70 factor [Fulvivirgaceae bacterium BMA12]|uniref:RNA polymerase sigma-70 factor n=1 Tax=Agaribacillus aureus TaxID=3051825 RepID=A0ABT8L7I4_9BACT|nr:RNA polymerase sigma-70 factor [Fulvivirgaceae bacterium BMA12]